VLVDPGRDGRRRGAGAGGGGRGERSRARVGRACGSLLLRCSCRRGCAARLALGGGCAPASGGWIPRWPEPRVEGVHDSRFSLSGVCVFVSAVLSTG
jgi:hypothetical protein